MDFSEVSIKIADITVKVAAFIDKINAIKIKYVTKINKLLEDLENTINSIATKSLQWIEIHVNKILKKIEDTVKSLLAKIDSIIKQLTEWYNKTMINIKRSVIKSVSAKLGIEMSDAVADGLAEAIPHPAIESFLPEIQLDIELPDLSNLAEIGQVSIPRLEI